jgi:tripartite-type tricarboxylate transporter receptor subunit TctC
MLIRPPPFAHAEDKMKRVAVALVAFAVVAGVGAASAADWPLRPLRIIAPSTPGGAADWPKA